MDEACGTFERQESCIQGLGVETLGKGLSVDGRIILKWFFNKWDGTHGLD
jgi:hypothetical protein